MKVNGNFSKDLQKLKIHTRELLKICILKLKTIFINISAKLFKSYESFEFCKSFKKDLITSP